MKIKEIDKINLNELREHTSEDRRFVGRYEIRYGEIVAILFFLGENRKGMTPSELSKCSQWSWCKVKAILQFLRESNLVYCDRDVESDRTHNGKYYLKNAEGGR